ncbi:MAG: hypothetical protein LBL83_12865, partial [Clostridiales bacterium]|nr:hypothetical protein [Clostridiales bacterium]
MGEWIPALCRNPFSHLLPVALLAKAERKPNESRTKAEQGQGRAESSGFARVLINAGGRGILNSMAHANDEARKRQRQHEIGGSG